MAHTSRFSRPASSSFLRRRDCILSAYRSTTTRQLKHISRRCRSHRIHELHLRQLSIAPLRPTLLAHHSTKHHHITSTHPPRPACHHWPRSARAWRPESVTRFMPGLRAAHVQEKKSAPARTTALSNPPATLPTPSRQARAREAASTASRSPLGDGRWSAPLSRRSIFLPCLLYTSPSPRDGLLSRMPSSA